MTFWGKAKWPPIGGWLLIRVAAHSRFYCIPCQPSFLQREPAKLKTDINYQYYGIYEAMGHNFTLLTYTYLADKSNKHCDAQLFVTSFHTFKVGIAKANFTIK